MRFTLSSTALSSRLQTLARVINSKNSLPILDSFLFEVHDQQLFITASDSENVMKSSLPLDECDGEGNFAVPNRTLLDAVKELAEQPLTFDVNTDSYAITIIYQNGSCTTHTKHFTSGYQMCRGFSLYHQEILSYKQGVQEFNSILTLSTQR